MVKKGKKQLRNHNSNSNKKNNTNDLNSYKNKNLSNVGKFDKKYGTTGLSNENCSSFEIGLFENIKYSLFLKSGYNYWLLFYIIVLVLYYNKNILEIYKEGIYCIFNGFYSVDIVNTDLKISFYLKNFIEYAQNSDFIEIIKQSFIQPIPDILIYFNTIIMIFVIIFMVISLITFILTFKKSQYLIKFACIRIMLNIIILIANYIKLLFFITSYFLSNRLWQLNKITDTNILMRFHLTHYSYLYINSIILLHALAYTYFAYLNYKTDLIIILTVTNKSNFITWWNNKYNIIKLNNREGFLYWPIDDIKSYLSKKNNTSKSNNNQIP